MSAIKHVGYREIPLDSFIKTSRKSLGNITSTDFAILNLIGTLKKYIEKMVILVPLELIFLEHLIH